MYLTYDEYVSMGGTLEPPVFELLEFDVEATINWYTFDRLTKFEVIPIEVKKLIVRLIALEQSELAIQPNMNIMGVSNVQASVASQSNDGVSTTYNTLSATELAEHNKNTRKELINRYLSSVMDSLGRNILYRGLYPGE